MIYTIITPASIGWQIGALLRDAYSLVGTSSR